MATTSPTVSQPSDGNHPATRLLVLRERDAMLELARTKLGATDFEEVVNEMEQALALPDDECTLVLDTIKTAWRL
jgi:hypothetical protein